MDDINEALAVAKENLKQSLLFSKHFKRIGNDDAAERCLKDAFYWRENIEWWERQRG